MELTQRAAEVILLLCEQPLGYPLTLAMVSEQLQVSRRTLQRVLPEIKDWMERNGYRFSSKAGIGMVLEEEDACRDIIRQKLDKQIKPASQGRSHVLRGQLIGLLLQSEEPIKIAWMSKRYQLSEGTMEKELDQIKTWLAQYGVHLRRRAGVGVYIEGTETAYRLAVEAAITTFSDPGDLLRLLKQGSIQEQACNFPLDFIVHEDMQSIQNVLTQAERRLNVHLTDSGFAGLFVHIALTIHRVRKGKLISMEPDRMVRSRLLPEYAVAEYITDQLKQFFSLHLPPDETGFITMLLAGSRIWKRDVGDYIEAAELDVLYLALAMTEIMEEQLGIPFRESNRLIEGLCIHLYALCSRLRMETPIENSQTEEIRSCYSALFDAAQKACMLLARELGVNALPDAEAAYIAMHYGAVLEDYRTKEQQITAVVVCPTGIGTSRLLAAELRRTYPNLKIFDIVSVLRLDIEILQKNAIDIIISTIDLGVKYRYICVNPILTERDRIVIGAALDTIRRQKPVETTLCKCATTPISRQDICFIRALGQEILSVIDTFRFRQAPIVENREALIKEAAQLFAETEIAGNDIELAFLRRDQLGDTYIKPFRALLLHCRTQFTTHCCFGYVRLEPPFYEKGRFVLGAIVMLIPEENSLEVCSTLMSEISSLLMRQPILLDYMRAGAQDQLTAALETEILEIYRTIVRRKLGEKFD